MVAMAQFCGEVYRYNIHQLVYKMHNTIHNLSQLSRNKSKDRSRNACRRKQQGRCRLTRKILVTHRVSFTIAQPADKKIVDNTPKVTVEEKSSAYEKEKYYWNDTCAYVQVSRKEVFSTPDVIGSRVILKRKPDGSVKVVIVPWEHRDLKKDSIRGDASCINLDGMRLLLSRAAKMK